jgi:hypothetical protein
MASGALDHAFYDIASLRKIIRVVHVRLGSLIREDYLRFTTDAVLLFSDFVGFHDLWYPRYFINPSKNEGTDNKVCVSCS